MLKRKKHKLGKITKLQVPLATPPLAVPPPQVPVLREGAAPQNTTLPIDLLIKKALMLMKNRF